MLVEEAKWIGRELAELVKGIKDPKVLNVGSGTLQKIDYLQSHQNKFVFKPLSNRNIKVLNTDIEAGKGVDLVGDLTDAAFIEFLRQKNFPIVLCNNLLEHITSIKPICESFKTLVDLNGYLIVSVPYIYPYHPDPIDTMFRPNVEELLKKIQGFSLIKGQIIKATRKVKNTNGHNAIEKNYFETLCNNKGYAFRLFVRLLFPFYKYKVWWNIARYLPFLFSSYKVTCVILKKK